MGYHLQVILHIVLWILQWSGKGICLAYSFAGPLPVWLQSPVLAQPSVIQFGWSRQASQLIYAVSYSWGAAYNVCLPHWGSFLLHIPVAPFDELHVPCRTPRRPGLRYSCRLRWSAVVSEVVGCVLGHSISQLVGGRCYLQTYEYSVKHLNSGSWSIA